MLQLCENELPKGWVDGSGAMFRRSVVATTEVKEPITAKVLSSLQSLSQQYEHDIGSYSKIQDIHRSLQSMLSQQNLRNDIILSAPLWRYELSTIGDETAKVRHQIQKLTMNLLNEFAAPEQANIVWERLSAVEGLYR